MKLGELKERVYEVWQDLITFNGALVQPENFKPEVRTFGDLRYKKTWQKAYASFAARSTWDSGITENTTICYVFNFTPKRWDYELRHQILGEYLAIPGAREFIIRGLEQIYRGNDTEDKECANELLGMVSPESGGTGRIAVGHIRGLTGANPA